VEPPPELLPGKQMFPNNANCDSMHNGTFNCRVNYRGSVIEALFDAKSHTIAYATVTTPDQVLADLVQAWGTPTGYSRSGQSVLVYWDTRVAYLAPCYVRPSTHVIYVSYGMPELPHTRWRGFVSQSGCSRPRHG